MQSLQCRYCEKKIYGRSDKKFCDHLCRSSFHNQVLAEANNTYRRINRVNLRNRSILKSLHQKQVSRSELAELGFQFNHCTSVVPNGNKTFFFCYDIGYLPLENNYFAVVSKEIHQV